MPNYSLVANTQFKARSFDDLIRPYVDYTKAYREQQDAIAELATKADVWAGLANEQTDPVAYAQYTNYANSLKDLATIMADRGLDPSWSIFYRRSFFIRYEGAHHLRRERSGVEPGKIRGKP